ncbi:hypothetical protein O1611_g7861 [Lasiodiplodia mahajangana]|uniref:Uncharacterized protein n=1 Tax=Lasiodiplodia mahajangana TaxID=1108764 RepID=A0ACC2JEI3_9PEZI|nr:hypothetical protein O1611_g7861 [Lasiodiplodia mahajangana]
MEQPEQPWHAAFPAPKTTQPASLSREEVLDKLRTGVVGRDFILVDVRRNDYEPGQGGTIRGAINLPAQSLFPTIPVLYQLFKNAGVRHVIWYCGSSRGRGTRAAGWFNDHIQGQGDEEMQSVILAGGIKGWAMAGDDFVTLMDGYVPGPIRFKKRQTISYIEGHKKGQSEPSIRENIIEISNSASDAKKKMAFPTTIDPSLLTKDTSAESQVLSLPDDNYPFVTADSAEMLSESEISDIFAELPPPNDNYPLHPLVPDSNKPKQLSHISFNEWVPSPPVPHFRPPYPEFAAPYSPPQAPFQAAPFQAAPFQAPPPPPLQAPPTFPHSGFQPGYYYPFPHFPVNSPPYPSYPMLN